MTVAAIEDVVPDIVTDNPMDMEFGPDGALYVLEYGDGYFAENPDGQALPHRLRRQGRQPQPRPGDRGRPVGRQGPAHGAVLQQGHDRP